MRAISEVVTRCLIRNMMTPCELNNSMTLRRDARPCAPDVLHQACQIEVCFGGQEAFLGRFGKFYKLCGTFVDFLARDLLVGVFPINRCAPSDKGNRRLPIPHNVGAKAHWRRFYSSGALRCQP